MYVGNIHGTTSTVGFEAMTALKRDGTALIPAPLVPELKGNDVVKNDVNGGRRRMVRGYPAMRIDNIYIKLIYSMLLSLDMD